MGVGKHHCKIFGMRRNQVHLGKGINKGNSRTQQTVAIEHLSRGSYRLVRSDPVVLLQHCNMLEIGKVLFPW